MHPARKPAAARPCGPVLLMLVVGGVMLGAGFFAGSSYSHYAASSGASQEAHTHPTTLSALPAATGARKVSPGTSSQLPHSAEAKAPLSTPAKAPWKAGSEVCTNTCSSANDGVCDEGRTKSGEAKDPMAPAFSVKCDLGTDCSDCGPWKPSASPFWDVKDKEAGPISLLMAKKIQVNVQPTRMVYEGKPMFHFAYTDSSKDLDVSNLFEFHRVVEYSISTVFYKIFKDRCIKPDGSRSLFLDVGSNFGWFSIVAARMGCRVIAYEPVPHFRAFLVYNVHLNGLEHLVEVRSTVVSNEHGTTKTMVVPTGGIWGTAGIDGLNIDKNIKAETESIEVRSVTLGKDVKEDVLLMKVDVEGWEWSVMQGAKDLFKNHNVQNIVMEYSPGVPERNFKFDEVIATVQMLLDICDYGYQIINIQQKDARANTLDVELPPYAQVKRKNLEYDMHDAQKMKVNELGCPMPKGWVGRISCGNSVPEDLSPRSFRSVFSHNTNIWATKQPELQNVQGTVGVLDLDDPPTKWTLTKYVDGGEDFMGMGFRRCRDMEPKWQVRHRCPCSDRAVCGDEEDKVKQFSEAGEIGSNYVLP